MVIGIDGSRAFAKERTGTENYTWEMLGALAEVDKQNRYRIYVKKDPHSKDSHSRSPGPPPNGDNWPGNFQFIKINWPRFWTQGGLALKTWTDQLDLLWVPAHTLPILGNPRLPMVVTLHGVEFEHLPSAYRWRQNFHLTWSTRWAVRRAQKIVAVSQKTQQDLTSWLKIRPGKTQVIYEGVDLDKFQNSRFSSQAAPNTQKVLEKYRLKQPYILFVGTVQPRKNLVRLIQAFSQFLEKPETCHRQFAACNLVIAGKLGWNYQKILTAPAKFGVGDRVKFLGYIPDHSLSVLYQHAALYVEPSLQEGFGLPVLEAMASGVPVVAADAGALPEVVGDAGILVDPYSVTAIASGLASGLAEKFTPTRGLKIPLKTSKFQGTNLRKELIARGYRQAAKFNWHQAAKQLVALFCQIKN